MITSKRAILWAMLMLMPPMRLPSQELLRLPPERLTAFVIRVGGIRGAQSLILAKSTPQYVREAVADSLVAIANSLPPESETRTLSHSDALAALMMVGQSDMPEVSEIGWSRFIRLALSGNTLRVRMNAVTSLGMFDDQPRGARALKTVATSQSDQAGEAVHILGTSYGAIGVSTLREIFIENSAVDPKAAAGVDHFAQRYKWTR